MAKIENRSFEDVHDIYVKYLAPDQVKRVDSAYQLAKRCMQAKNASLEKTIFITRFRLLES